MVGKKPIPEPVIDDFGFEPFDPESPDISSSNIRPMTRALKGAAEGAKDSLMTRDTLKNLVRAAVPPGIGRTLDTVDEITTTASTLYNSVATQLAPELNSLKRNVRRLMPKVRGKLPESVANTIDNLVRPTEEIGHTEYDADSSAITESLRNIYEAEQLREEYHRSEDKAEEAIREKIRTTREKTELNTLKAIRRGVEDAATYRDTVATRRDQKLLELQYRQYFTQRDLLTETKNANVTVLDQLKALVENTSLPDIAKVKEYERRERENHLNLISRGRTRVEEFTTRFKDQLQERLNKSITQVAATARKTLSGANIGLSTAASAASLPSGVMSGMDNWHEGGRMVGGLASDTGVVEKLGGLIGRQLRRIPGLRRLDQRLDYFHDNAPEMLSEWASRPSRGIKFGNNPFDMNKGFGAGALDMVKSMIPRFNEGTTDFTAGGFNGVKDTVSYDTLSRKSIVEIIPDLLSNILREVTSIRTGEPEERLRYNHQSGMFEKESDYKENIREQVLPNSTVEQLSKRTDEFVKRLNRGSKLSPEALNGLRTQVIYNMTVGRRFNPESFIKGRGLDQIQDPEVLSELRAHFRKMFPVDAYGKIINSTRSVARLRQYSSQYQGVRNLIPDTDEAIGNLLDVGARSQLRDIGVLRQEGGREFFDPRFMVNALSAKGAPTNEEPSDEKTPESGSGSDTGRSSGNNRRSNPDNHRDVSPTSDDTENTETPLKKITERLKEKAESNQHIESTMRAAGEFTQKVRDFTKRRVKEEEEGTNPDESVEDIYVPGEDEPRLTKNGFRSGRYYSHRTKRRLRKIGDIFGAVTDALGNVLLTIAEMIAGVVTGTGKYLSGLSARAEGWVDRTSYVSGLIADRIANATDKFKQGLFGLRGRVDDVYIIGMPDPVMTAEKMRQQYYIDRRTRKPINTIDDIKGAVEDREGNVVLSWDDYDRGLYLKDGTLVRRKGLLYQTGRFINWYFGGYYRNLWKLLTAESKLGKKLVGYAVNKLTGVPDCYVPGEESPRLLARNLRRGLYLSSRTGRPIYKPSQIDSDVIGIDGQVVLTLDEARQGLVDKYGKPIRGLTNRFLRSAVGGVGRLLGGMGRYWRKSQHFMGDMAAKGLLATTDAIGWGIDKLTGFRKGSWQERRYQREQAKKEKKEKDKNTNQKDKKGGILGTLLLVAGILKTGFGLVSNLLSPLKYLKDILTTTRMLAGAGDLLGGLGGGKLGKAAKRLGKGGLALLRRGGAMVASTVGRVAATEAATMALSGLGTAGAAVAGALGTAATAIGGVLTAPVTLTLAAVAATGFAAWWLWKKYGSSPDPVQAVRLAEYGVNLGDTDLCAKVLKLEESVSDYTEVRGGTASFTKALPVGEIFKLFDIDASNPNYQSSFINWLRLRFRPVYLRFAAKGEELSPGSKVHQQDDKIADGDKPTLVRETRYSNADPEYPYNITDGPQPPNPAVTGTVDIDKAILHVEQKFAKAERDKQARNITKQRRAENEEALRGGRNPLEEARKLNTPENRYTTDSKLERVRKDTISQHGDVSSALWEAGSSRKIDELSGIRYRTYGLVELDRARVDSLSVLETDLAKQIAYAGGGIANLDYDPVALYELYGARFGLNIADSKHRSRWVEWFKERFLPTFLAYATAVRMCNRSVPLNEAWSMLKTEDQIRVAQAVVGATYAGWFVNTSVWKVDTSPWLDYALNMDSSSVNEAMDSLRAKQRNEKLTETRTAKTDVPTQGDGLKNYVTAKDSNDKALAQNINSILNATGTLELQQRKPTVERSGNDDTQPSGGWSGIYKSDSGGRVGDNPTVGSGVGGSYGSARAGSMGDGTGGMYQSLPDSKGEGWDNNKDLIVAASKMAGVDAGTMATFASIESSFKPRVKADTSSASGLYQFISDTWLEMIDRYGAKYGIPPGTPPFDPKANALMGAEFIKENARYLSKFIGHKPTDADLYLAHFMGADGARKLLQLSPDTTPASMFPKQAAANKSIFYLMTTKKPYQIIRERSKAEVIAELNRRVRVGGGKFAAAAEELAAGESGVAETDPTAQGTAEASASVGTDVNQTQTGTSTSVGDSGGSEKDTTVTLPESSVTNPSGSDTPTMDVGNGYMGDIAPVTTGGKATPPPEKEPTPKPDEPKLSPVAEQTLGTEQAQRRASKQVSSRSKQAEVVTNKELSDILGNQLVTQIEIRDLVRELLETRLQSSEGTPTKKGNDKSTTSNVQDRSSLTRGGVSMKRNL